MTPDLVREAVWEKKPMLRQLMQEHGHQSVAEYYKLSQPASIPVDDNRWQELRGVFLSIVEPLLGADAAGRAAEHLQKTRFVSTADHHGPVCHPFFFNANLAQAFISKEPVLVFSCGGISANNSSYPRGLIYHDEKGEQHVPFISLKHRHVPVYALPAYGKNAANLSNETLCSVYFAEDVLSQQRYSQQVTITNYELWRQLPGLYDSELIYIEQEELVVQLLLKHHLQTKTELNALLFDPETRQAFAKYFDGLAGAFDSQNNHGTFLFWGIKDGKRVRFSYDGRALVSENWQVPLEPEAIAAGLASGQLMPSMALSFIVLMFYYGVTCGGGFSQINYLPAMQDAYEKVANRKIEMNGSVFRGDFLLAILERQSGLVPATGLDWFLYGNNETATDAKSLLDTLTLNQAIDGMMPVFYKIITGQKVAYDGYQHPKPILSLLRQ